MRRLSDSHFTSPGIDILSIMARHFHILLTITFPKLSANSNARTSGFYASFDVKERRWISDRLNILVLYIWRETRLFGSRIFKVKCWSGVILKTEFRFQIVVIIVGWKFSAVFDIIIWSCWDYYVKTNMPVFGFCCQQLIGYGNP